MTQAFVQHAKNVLLCLLIGLLVFPGCKKPICKKQVVDAKADVALQLIIPDDAHAHVTVFIHGTRIFPKFYLQELYYSPEGFRHISQLEEAFHMHTIAQTLAKADPKSFSTDAFYAFGWNGNLDFNERKNAAKNLYQALKELSQCFYAKHGKRPYLQLITHSHGGNVALNLVTAVKEAQDTEFFIDRLILLACPVQQETKDCIADPFFRRVYSLCSCNDLLQVVDPQGLYDGKEKAPLFSERYFEEHPRLLQAKIRHRGRYILHIEFLKKYFYMQLPHIMYAMDTWYEQVKAQLRNSVHVPWIDMFGKKVQIYPKMRTGSAKIKS